MPPEQPGEAVDRLVSRGTDMGMEPEQEERGLAAALAKAVETVAANGLSVRMRRGCARSWIGTERFSVRPSW